MQPLASTRRRWLALCLLALAWAQVNWGVFLLREVLRGWVHGLYWVVCLLLALVAGSLAAAELTASWRAWRRQRRQSRDRYDHLLD